MRVVVRLFDETQFFPLALIEPRLDRVGLLQPLQREDEQLGVVLVTQRREWDGRETP